MGYHGGKGRVKQGRDTVQVVSSEAHSDGWGKGELDKARG